MSHVRTNSTVLKALRVFDIDKVGNGNVNRPGDGTCC